MTATGKILKRELDQLRRCGAAVEQPHSFPSAA